MTRAERVEQVNALKREGLNGMQIAARLGISRAHAYELLSDPEGAGVRKRKLKAGGTCVDCGAPTAYKTGGPAAQRCRSCQDAFSRDWTRERIIDWIRAFHAEHGFVPPASVQKRPGAPGTRATRREFGTDCWRAAVRAAGFEPYQDAPGAGHQLGTDHPLMQETARLYGEGLSLSQIAERHGVTHGAIRYRLRHLGVERRDPVEARNLRRLADRA